MSKIAVAMSGGVDSSVAAALLKAQGNEVIGLYFDLGNPDSKVKMRKAKAIADKLEIDFRSIDVAKIFKKEIIDDFVRSYERGLTPNPCVVCNKKIKFDFLLREAEHLGCDLAATGHYVKSKEQTSPNPSLVRRGNTPLDKERKFGIFPSLDKERKFGIFPSLDKGRLGGVSYKLLTAKDETKDQSYFLYTLTQEQLKKLVFPLGEYTKVEVKKMAKDLGIVPDGESQDVCFLAGTTCSEFLQKNIKAKPGKIRDIFSCHSREGGNPVSKIIGEHKGLHLYTIGQRKGIEVGGTGPYYVVRKDYGTNELIVSNDAKDISLLKDSLIAADVNWIAGKAPKFPFKCKARIRYQSELVACVIRKTSPNPSLVRRGNTQQTSSLVRRGNTQQTSSLVRRGNTPLDKEGKFGIFPPLDKGRLGGVLYIQFTKPQKSITSGQSIVFYKGKEILGGGVIES